MKVILAGYNIDTEVIEEAKQKGIDKEKLSPEVISAAYARISRSSAPVNELRQNALQEVSRARKSNQKIIFQMGHHSIAEHSVFNFDVLNLSRLAIEELEHHRLCSFTEKSQRYITLDNDYVMPEELKNTPYENELKALISNQANVYTKLHQDIYKTLEKKHPDLIEKKSSRNMVDGWAKEDARYATLLCTSGQLGLTVNARNLELIIKRLNASKLTELKELAKHLFNLGVDVAPSLLLFTEPSKYELETKECAKKFAQKFLDVELWRKPHSSVELIRCTLDADRFVAATLLCSATKESLKTCMETVNTVDNNTLKSLFKDMFSNMEFYDTPPREFEHVDFTFEITLSAAAYGQLKRHRMMSQTVQDYYPSLGVTTPTSISESKYKNLFYDHIDKSETLYSKIYKDMPHIAPYVLTNAHRRRVTVTANLRTLYHFCRLREDAHAQWDIRNIAAKINSEVSKVMPLSSMLLCGKDTFDNKKCNA